MLGDFRLRMIVEVQASQAGIADPWRLLSCLISLRVSYLPAMPAANREIGIWARPDIPEAPGSVIRESRLSVQNQDAVTDTRFQEVAAKA